MKAFQIRKYKGPLEVAQVATPTVGQNDVLLDVSAASLNQLDEMLRVGTFKATLPYKLPLTLGNDFAGYVVGVGQNVSNFKAGDRVFAKPNQKRIGAFAELIAVDQADLALAPSSISIEEAASLPLVGLTSWQALVERGNLQAGQSVLIHGGAGGVGSIAIQLARHLGARVTTTVSGKNASFANELGAQTVIDYKVQDFSKLKDKFDLILDTQGGDTLLKSLEILKPGGLVIGLAGPPDEHFAIKAGLSPVLKFVIKQLSSKVTKKAKALGVRYEFLFVQSNGEQLTQLAQLVDAGLIKPIVGKTFVFDEAPAALQQLATGKIGRGKAVIMVKRS
jgi:NADPH:quinone reductase-like Zn-dependent oxidoreductase